MMNKTRYTNRLGVVALLGVILTVGILFAGCSEAFQSEKKPAAKVETNVSVPTSAKSAAVEKVAEKPAKAAAAVTPADKPAEKAETAPPAAIEAPASAPAAAPEPVKAQLSPEASEAEVLAAIKGSKELFEFYALKQEIAQRPDQSDAVQTAVQYKWEEFEAANPPQTLIEGLDFVAIKLEPAGEKQGKFSVLLKTTADMDTDYQVSISGRVDPSHKSLLSEAARNLNDREAWPVREWDYKKSEWTKADDVSKWKAGEYHMLSRIGACAPIPYDLSITLQIWDKGRWVSNAGNTIKLGWYAPIEE